MNHQKTALGLKFFLGRLRLRFLTKPRALRYWRKSNENKFLKGQLKATSSHPSILFIAPNKSGSSISATIISEILLREGLIQLDWEGYYACTEPEIKNTHFSGKQFRDLQLPETGFFIGPLRRSIEIPESSPIRVIIQIRDPRDILVSHYYSMTRSHPVLTENYLKRKLEASHKTIDQHVLDEAPRFRQLFTELIRSYFHTNNALFIRYEEMVESPEEWIKKTMNFLSIPLEKHENTISKLNHHFTQGEGENKHKRQVKPGNFREQLLPETIDALNHEFSEILRTFNYSIS